MIFLLSKRFIIILTSRERVEGSWIHPALHRVIRQAVGEEVEPTAAIMDSQSVKTTELAQSRGFNDHKPVKGRKRHIVVDTLGIPLIAKVHEANLADGKQACELLESMFCWFFSLQMIWVDAAYRGR